MKKIWAPWRIEYINSKKEKGCLFCKKKSEKKDQKNYILFRGKKIFVMMNIYPYNNGHLMVVPFKHIPDPEKLVKEEEVEIMEMIKKSIRVLRKTYGAQGFNVGINLGKVAGAGVRGHFHIHIVPRWEGDTNFMPVVADTKIICQSLKAGYKELKKEFEKW